MFRRIRSCLIAVVGVAVMVMSAEVFGQLETDNIVILKNKTQDFYNEGNYVDALRGFSILGAKYPGEPMYRYYMGVCMVKINRDIDEAIEHLYYASSRGVPEDSYFYLGMAYQLQYNFAEAERYFRRFEREGTRQQNKDLNVKYYISECQSARDLTARYNPFEVLNVAFINLYDSAQFSQVKMRGGTLSRKPAQFFSDREDHTGLNSLMFMPKDTERGQYVYFTGYSTSGKTGADLYRVRKLNSKVWSDPEAIKFLNTDMDELLPYFDPIESDLYFASNGRAGIGGLDLYKSHYDVERDEWSEPMNLGFPVNSVLDDYLFLPGNDMGMVMFFTARQATDSTVTVYRVRLMEPRQPLSASDTRKLQRIAMLGGVAEEALADIEEAEQAEAGVMISGSEAPKGIENQKVNTQTVKAEKSDYQLNLARALGHQVISDSLSKLAVDARIRVRESDDPNDRWVWQKQIMVWEKKAKDEQQLADEIFASLEAGQKQIPAKNIPETIQVDRVVNDITVYTYTEAGQQRVVADRIEPAPVADNTGNKNQPPESMSRFELLSSSPYTDSNPIPMEILLPPGVFYRIQLGAFGREVAPGTFGGISPVTGEFVEGQGLYKYYAGKFSHYTDASGALQTIKLNGYPTAFIVAYYNGRSTSTSKAQALEQ